MHAFPSREEGSARSTRKKYVCHAWFPCIPVLLSSQFWSALCVLPLSSDYVLLTRDISPHENAKPNVMEAATGSRTCRSLRRPAPASIAQKRQAPVLTLGPGFGCRTRDGEVEAWRRESNLSTCQEAWNGCQPPHPKTPLALPPLPGVRY